MCLVILICCVVDQSCSTVIQYNYYLLTVDYTIHVDTCMYESLHVSLKHLCTTLKKVCVLKLPLYQVFVSYTCPLWYQSMFAAVAANS